MFHQIFRSIGLVSGEIDRILYMDKYLNLQKESPNFFRYQEARYEQSSSFEIHLVHDTASFINNTL